MNIPFCLPNGISSDDFIRNYWGKRPLLIKNGLPSLANMFEPIDVLELALQDGASTRLICQDSTGFSLKNINAIKKIADFDALSGQWTVLVQNLEQWSYELGQLWQAFDFLPRFEQDDIMVSYAPNGAGVGQHFDEYDVFLAQGYGKRRWRLGKWCDQNTPLVPNQPMKIIDDMGGIIFDEVLEAGDVLYVPPRLAHDGVAVGDCLTFSFGFRRPSVVQLLDTLADVATSEKSLFSPLALPVHSHAHALSDDTIYAIKHALIDALQAPQNHEFFGRALAELLSKRSYDLVLPEEFGENIESCDIADSTLALNPACRVLDTPIGIYANGQIVEGESAKVVRAVLDKKSLDSFNKQTLADLVNEGVLVAIFE